MSADAREFTSPNIEARDYYTRLGVPEGAEAEVIERNVKKHVRDFMPQVSDHERAEERWERFNQARRTLKDPDEKEQYDTFRERFGPERGTEAFEKWEARGRRKDPAKLDSVRDLGLPAGKEPDETSDGATDPHHQQRSETDSTTEPRFRQQRQTEQSRQRREYDIDIDLDSTKAHSTRSPGGEPSEETTDEAGDERSSVVWPITPA